MKTNFIIASILIILFEIGGCTVKDNSDFKVTVVPESQNTVTTINNMKSAAEVISKRLNYYFSIPQENIITDVTDSQITLTVLKVETRKISSIKEIITNDVRLEFRETYENKELIESLTKANTLLKELKPVSNVKNDIKPDEFTAQNPLFGILRPRVNASGEPLPSCMIGLASGKDTATVNSYMKMPEIKALLPADLKLMWSMNTYKYDPSKTLYEMHAIKATIQDDKAPLDGSAIISAAAIKGHSKSDIKIDLTMNADGTTKWSGITRKNIKRCIAVVINGYVRSYPMVQAEISGSNTEITGDFTIEEANDLVYSLKSGVLPFKLKIINEQIIKAIDSK